jgi:hypothetical protein
MIVTIHQPDFFPWQGFFSKLFNSDIWVVLDHVKNNPRDAAFWGRRVKILVNGNAHWLSIPLKRPEEKGTIGVPIRDLRINKTVPNILNKGFKTIQMAYKNAPFYNRYKHLVEEYYFSEDTSLIVRNMTFIKSVMDILRIQKKIIYSSNLSLHKNKTELLVEIIKSVKSSKYLCGGGADKYQNNNLFFKNNIEVIYNNYKPSVYNQRNNLNFVPGLSIIDSLFQIPIEDIQKMIS